MTSLDTKVNKSNILPLIRYNAISCLGFFPRIILQLHSLEGFRSEILRIFGLFHTLEGFRYQKPRILRQFHSLKGLRVHIDTRSLRLRPSVTYQGLEDQIEVWIHKNYVLEWFSFLAKLESNCSVIKVKEWSLRKAKLRFPLKPTPNLYWNGHCTWHPPDNLTYAFHLISAMI